MTEHAQHRLPGALDPVLAALACPVCGQALEPAEGQLRCGDRHAFNLAKQGYASLLTGARRTSPGDDADMVAARADFLATGHYLPIADAVSAAIPASTAGLCVDIAGGTGYYLSHVLEARAGLVGLSLDLSPFAARRAARAHPRQAAATADAWRRLPLADGSATRLLSIFGPRNADEMARVLHPAGELIVVTPTARHLQELRRELSLIGVDSQKQERLDAQLSRFTRVAAHDVEYGVRLTRDDVFNDVRMGPNAHHTEAGPLRERIDALGDETLVTVSVTVARYALRAQKHPAV
ncbi:methyltransferase domain-containing protein [Okibacterium endophyticum]